MSTIPSILTSAQSVLQTGFARQNKAAAEMTAGRRGDGGQTDIENGVVDLARARTEVRTGVALARSYEETTHDLLDMTDTRPYDRRIDLYA